MVSASSAAGRTGNDGDLLLPDDNVHRIGGLHHLDLLNHPAVYERLRDVLANGPLSLDNADGT
jgi:hypothetical protein